MVARVRKRAARAYRRERRVEEGVVEPEPSCLWRPGRRVPP